MVFPVKPAGTGSAPKLFYLLSGGARDGSAERPAITNAVTTAVIRETTMRNILMASGVAVTLALTGGASWAQQQQPSTQTGPRGSAGTTGMERPSAQTGVDISNLKVLDTKNMNLTYNGISADTIKSADVYGANDEKIGSVDKVLAGPDDRIVAVTVDAGGFLGIGAKEVVMPLDKLSYDGNSKQFKTTMSKDDVKSMPEWK
jgi:hypothetical protein